LEVEIERIANAKTLAKGVKKRGRGM